MSTHTEAGSVLTHLRAAQQPPTPPSTKPHAVLPNLAYPSRTDCDNTPWAICPEPLAIKPTACTRYEETFVFVNPMAIGPPATVNHQQDQDGTPRPLFRSSHTVKWLRRALVGQASRLRRHVKVVKLKICNLRL